MFKIAGMVSHQQLKLVYTNLNVLRLLFQKKVKTESSDKKILGTSHLKFGPNLKFKFLLNLKFKFVFSLNNLAQIP